MKPRSVPGLPAVLRKVVLATGPASRFPSISLDDLGLVEVPPDVCFWCQGPIASDGHADHLLGVIDDGKWNGLPELIVPSHPRCNTGRGKGLERLVEDERVRAKFRTVEELTSALRYPPDVVNGYNRLLREFADVTIEAYQRFLAEVEAWWDEADLPEAHTAPFEPNTGHGPGS